MRPFSRPSVANALRRFFSVDGGTPAVQLSEEISPVQALSGPLDEGPYGSTFRTVANSLGKTPGAGEFAYVGVRPQRDVALQVMQVILMNDSAAALFIPVRFLSAANVTTVGVDTSSPMADVAGGQVGLLAASNIWAGSHNVATVLTAGIGIAALVPAGSTVIIDIKQPLVLWGNDPGGIPSMVAVAQTADATIRTAWSCREWPIVP